MSENRNEKYFVLNFCMIGRNGIAIVAKISIQLDLRPRPKIHISMRGVTSHSTEPVDFLVGKEYVRYKPKEDFQKWFKIIKRDQFNGIDKFKQYIHESEENGKYNVSLSLLGSSNRRF